MLLRRGKFQSLLFLLAILMPPTADAEPVPVRVQRGAAGWELRVDGNPFWVKGVGCNTSDGTAGEDYLLMAKNMGANAVRTWGGTTREYLDRAQQHGLKVMAGIWLNPVRNEKYKSYRDRSHLARLKIEILSHVAQLKDHPALLSWCIGNEVFAFTPSDEEKAAFGAFLEEIIRSVHQDDPNHPVTYASAGTMDLPYLQKFVPSLDIVGVNTYGGFPSQCAWLRNNSFNKPVVATEFGPVGSWDRPKDPSGIAYDMPDQFKADNYISMWRQIESAKGQSLGGFAFVLGEQRNQDSFTWFNLNVGSATRAGYWALYELYTGKGSPVLPPSISRVILEPQGVVSPGAALSLEGKVQAGSDLSLAFDYFIADISTDPLTVEKANFFRDGREEVAPGTARLSAPLGPGKYRAYLLVKDGAGNAAVANRPFRVEAVR